MRTPEAYQDRVARERVFFMKIGLFFFLISYLSDIDVAFEIEKGHKIDVRDKVGIWVCFFCHTFFL